jgi:hypothetical protein
VDEDTQQAYAFYVFYLFYALGPRRKEILELATALRDCHGHGHSHSHKSHVTSKVTARDPVMMSSLLKSKGDDQ